MECTSVIMHASCYWVTNKKKGCDYLENFHPACSHSTIQLVLAFTSVAGGRSLDLDAVCAFISSKLAESKRVCMKGPPAGL